MEYLKDYNYTFNYYPGKANVVVNALSKKSWEVLASYRVVIRELIQEFSDMDLIEEGQTQRGILVLMINTSNS